jgi:predicted MPP superfamily phosphohydrolase
MPHEMRVALIMGVALIAFAGLGRYLFGHVTEAFGLKLRPRTLYLFLLVTALSAVLPRFFAPWLGGTTPYVGMFATLVVLGMLISGALLAPYAVGRALLRGLRRLRRGPDSEASAQAAPADLSRRAFVHQAAVGGAFSIGVGATAYGTLVGRHDYALETVPIKLAKLPRALDGFSIVQLSDLHVGSFVSDYEFRRGLELVRRARPDLIVLTGDLIDHDVRYVKELGRFVRMLSEVSRRGVFAVMGNHDHYTGVDQVERALGAAGAQVLTNRHVRIGDGKQQFVLAGLDDVMGSSEAGRGPNLPRAFAGASPDLARVLLSHNPGYFPTSHPYADLTLSGHTHGGQITLFINPAELLLRHGLVRGHYSRDHSQIYVNRGFGTAGPPTRVGSTPEITKLVLTT